MERNETVPPLLLSVVIPMYNEAEYIADTLRSLRTAIARAGLIDDCEVIIVDDGSTDGSGAEALSSWEHGTTVVTQDNRGRLTARRRGMAAAHGDFVLALDARSMLDSGSLEFWNKHRIEYPECRLWNGDIRTRSDANPYARFWEILARIGWGEYIRNPRRVSFGAAEFDRFPKGTGMFLAPRDVWDTAYQVVETNARLGRSRDLVSDDTALLREMTMDGNLIWIDPNFSGEYVSSRRTLRAFMKNAFYRGGTFVDSYYEAPSKLGSLVRAAPIVVPLGIAIGSAGMLRFPKQIGIAACASVLAPGAAAAAVAVRSGDSVMRSSRVGALSLPFMCAFFPGLVRAYVARWLLRRG